MYASAEVGLRLSRISVRQHVALLSTSCSFKARKMSVGAREILQGRECPVSFRKSDGRCFATESSGYSVVSSSSEDGMLSEKRPLERRRLVLYSKPGCCLCDALKEKLQLAFMLRGENGLSDVELEVRDITSNEEWEKLYQYEIPVLKRLKGDASEEIIPRFSPRLTVEQLQKKLAAALNSKE